MPDDKYLELLELIKQDFDQEDSVQRLADKSLDKLLDELKKDLARSLKIQLLLGP